MSQENTQEINDFIEVDVNKGEINQSIGIKFEVYTLLLYLYSKNISKNDQLVGFLRAMEDVTLIDYETNEIIQIQCKGSKKNNQSISSVNYMNYLEKLNNVEDIENFKTKKVFLTNRKISFNGESIKTTKLKQYRQMQAGETNNFLKGCVFSKSDFNGNLKIMSLDEVFKSLCEVVMIIENFKALGFAEVFVNKIVESIIGITMNLSDEKRKVHKTYEKEKKEKTTFFLKKFKNYKNSAKVIEYYNSLINNKDVIKLFDENEDKFYENFYSLENFKDIYELLDNQTTFMFLLDYIISEKKYKEILGEVMSEFEGWIDKGTLEIFLEMFLKFCTYKEDE